MITKAAKDNNITMGIILNGIGSLTAYKVHVVDSCDLPPAEAFFGDEKAYDIVQITGFVNNGRVHAHITVSDDKKVMGGHLEPGCKALTFAIISLAEVIGIDLKGWDSIREF